MDMDMARRSIGQDSALATAVALGDIRGITEGEAASLLVSGSSRLT